jgi:hypothetical protein
MSIDHTVSKQEPAKPTVDRFTLQQQAFFRSEAALKAKGELKLMVDDPNYNTRETFSAKHEHDMPFVDRHMKYMSEHPKMNPRHYLSNLQLMTKIKR